MMKLSERYPLLSRAGTPEELKKIPREQLGELAEEVRNCLIETVSTNGGHLASNLGVVELTIALHRVLNCPKDHIIWDVGHQSYVHKLFTERAEFFDTLRRPGGISGFTRRQESRYDCFGAGHSSTSLSAAVGFAESDLLQHSDAFTVAVVGDGAFTGGMIHEAFNNCSPKLRLIVILNENEMSISKNIGRFARNLSRLRIRSGYFKTKAVTGRVLRRIPLVGKPLYRLVRNLKVSLKNSLYGSNYFEDLGMCYLGPLDGNNEADVEQALREAVKLEQAVVIHLKTKKGKGYAPAEDSPCGYHGVLPCTQKSCAEDSFSAEMGNYLTTLAEADPKICGITAAMETGTGLGKFHEIFPDRFFDVGIAEEHAVTFAAGLAANGMKPVFAVYSTFLQRSYDNLLHDVALQNLPLVLCVDRAGLNAADGATHHGIFDVSFLSSIPGTKIYTPVTYAGLRLSLRLALADSCISAIRYPGGRELPQLTEAFYSDGSAPNEVSVRTDGYDKMRLDAVIVTHGRIAAEALQAKEMLRLQGVRVGVILCEFLKPYDVLAKCVAREIPQEACSVLFLEEEIRNGGFGVCLRDALEDSGVLQNKAVSILATEDRFVIQTKEETVYETAGVSAAQIAGRILESERRLKRDCRR